MPTEAYPHSVSILPCPIVDTHQNAGTSSTPIQPGPGDQGMQAQGQLFTLFVIIADTYLSQVGLPIPDAPRFCPIPASFACILYFNLSPIVFRLPNRTTTPQTITMRSFVAALLMAGATVTAQTTGEYLKCAVSSHRSRFLHSKTLT